MEIEAVQLPCEQLLESTADWNVLLLVKISWEVEVIGRVVVEVESVDPMAMEVEA